ncbi:MAG TPA: amidase [Ktedonobacteraceae bacterium]|nr:amidase [Ktedonobacteraceae bacterium]
MDELIYTSATSLAQAIRDKQVSSQEVVEAYIHRIEAVNPQLNAVVQLTADTALTQSRQADVALARGEIKGPLHGVPISIKDSFDTEGVISTAGTKGRASYVPQQDATAVARMRAAGAILLGKTNLPELSLAYESNNLIYGRTNNPYDLSRTSGGSSGGESAIIAAGGSPLGLGTDAGGSIRVPSHFCGIAGLKPTSGSIPFTGLMPPAFGASARIRHVGPMARYVVDLALTFPILAGMDWRDPATVPMPPGEPGNVELKSLRVAFYTDNGIMSPTHETIGVVRTAVHALADVGASVEEARPAGIEQSYEIFRDLFAADGGAGAQRLLQMVGTTEVHPFLYQLGEILRPYAMTTAEFSSFLVRWDIFRSTLLSFLEKYDVIICPVCAKPAWHHSSTITEEQFVAGSYSITYNLTGWPAVVVRGGTSPEGLPIGVQVVARPWREDVALAVAQHLETILGGWQRPNL